MTPLSPNTQPMQNWQPWDHRSPGTPTRPAVEVWAFWYDHYEPIEDEV